MAQHTAIEWCDSTLNLQMGCDGCELWNPNSRQCYAGLQTERYAGAKGWPVAFDKPAIFGERLDAALRWPDLRGKNRHDKPWLNGLPRVVFLNDVGDTFTESLPLDWLMPYVERLAYAPWIVMLLTKRPARMRAFFELLGSVPLNFRLGTSVTSRGTLPRIAELAKLKASFPDAFMWLSGEPLLESLDLRPYLFHDVAPPFAAFESGAPLSLLSHVILGGSSGRGAMACHVEWIRGPVADCRAAGVPVFVKQLGSDVRSRNDNGFEGDTPRSWPMDTRTGESEAYQGAEVRVRLRSSKGGDMREWPEDLRVRQFPRAA